ncbi:hypothetical protein [Kineococcus indalonis]|uniref:hypothetical protein n=1 Tax=Kineococcus indalonis TaxID=2696566 RepID=UPI001412FD5F|nr:hypothetical protein [Kineococcus indalonis]NAZ86278.1 hypothetical protein [Kineococcus indalonis]
MDEHVHQVHQVHQVRVRGPEPGRAAEELWRQVSVHRALLRAERTSAAARALVAESALVRATCAHRLRESSRVRELSVVARWEAQLRPPRLEP